METLATIETDLRLNLRLFHGLLFEIAESPIAQEIQPTSFGAEHLLNDTSFLRVELKEPFELTFSLASKNSNLKIALEIIKLYQEILKGTRR